MNVLRCAALTLGLAASAAVVPASAAEFVPGTGTSSAGFARIQMRSSGAAIGFGLGVARTRFAGAQGNAQAASVDLGLFDTLKKVPLACGYSMEALFPPGVPPDGVTVSSADGATERRTASAGEDGPVQFGSQYGAAAPDASASAVVDAMSVRLPGVLEAAGGTASSTARLVPGEQRQSVADSTMSTLALAGGLVRLEGLRWAAEHRSGVRPEARAGFSVGSMLIGGAPVPTDSPQELSAAFAAANAALAATGLTLTPPEASTRENGVSVGPLRLTVTATPTLRAVLDPAITALQPLRSELLPLVAPVQAGPNCGLATALGFGYLGVDLATLVLGEGGALDVDLGGAAAGTEATAFDDPFASGFGLIAPPPATEPRAPARGPVAVAAPPAPPTSAVPAALDPPARRASGAPVTASVVAQAVPQTPVALSCRSAHPNAGGCDDGHGRLAAWLGLILIALLAAVDRVRARWA